MSNKQLAVIVLVGIALVCAGYLFGGKVIIEKVNNGLSAFSGTDVSKANYFGSPNELSNNYIGSEVTYTAHRRCSIDSGENTCYILNNSNHDWLVESSIVLSQRATATTTLARFFVGTSTAALTDGSGSFPWGYSTTTFATSIVKATLGTTTSYGVAFNRVFSQSYKSTMGGTSTAMVLVRAGKYLNWRFHDYA